MPGRPPLCAIALQQRHLADWHTPGTEYAGLVAQALPDSGGKLDDAPEEDERDRTAGRGRRPAGGAGRHPERRGRTDDDWTFPAAPAWSTRRELPVRGPRRLPAGVEPARMLGLLLARPVARGMVRSVRSLARSVDGVRRIPPHRARLPLLEYPPHLVALLRLSGVAVPPMALLRSLRPRLPWLGPELLRRTCLGVRPLQLPQPLLPWILGWLPRRPFRRTPPRLPHGRTFGAGLAALRTQVQGEGRGERRRQEQGQGEAKGKWERTGKGRRGGRELR